MAPPRNTLPIQHVRRLQTLYCTDDSDGSYAHPFWLTDLSARGARLRGYNIADTPDNFLLSVKGHEGGVWHCEVVWRSEAEIGVKFVDFERPRLEPPDLRLCLQDNDNKSAG